MAFTFDENLLTPRDWVRFNVADTVLNKGPRVEEKNFSDEEIAALLLRAKNDTDLVISQVFEALASEWMKLAISYQIGPRKEDLTKLAEGYAQKAEMWAERAGTGYKSFSSGMYRAGSRENSELN